MTVTVRRTESARDYHTQQEHFLYRKVTYSTPLLQSTAGKIVYVGVLPANCLKRDTVVRINTTFDGDLIIGTSNNTSAYASTADVVAGEADTYVSLRGYGALSTVDLPVYAQLTTGSTVGEAEIWLTYLPAK